MPQPTMRIGQVARAAGVNIQTLRYYERRGLLPEPPRTASGYRTYGPDAIKIVRFVKKAQELGFTLREIDDLLRLRSNDKATRAGVQQIVEAKLQTIDEKLRRLEALRVALVALVDACKRRGGAVDFPLLEVLADELPDR